MNLEELKAKLSTHPTQFKRMRFGVTLTRQDGSETFIGADVENPGTAEVLLYELAGIEALDGLTDIAAAQISK